MDNISGGRLVNLSTLGVFEDCLGVLFALRTADAVFVVFWALLPLGLGSDTVDFRLLLCLACGEIVRCATSTASCCLSFDPFSLELLLSDILS
jgi:hypothetical protein